MNYIQTAQLESYKLIVFEAETYKESIADIPKFASSITKLQEICNEIDKIRVEQESDLTGITEDKLKILDDLITEIVYLSGALQSYAREKENNTLYERINFKEYLLIRAAHLSVSSAAGIIIDEAEKLSPEDLAAEGIGTGDLERFKKLHVEFKNKMQTPRQAIINRKVYTEKIADLLREAYELKKDILDNLAVQFRKRNPEFYFKYKAACNVIIKRGRRKVKKEEKKEMEEVIEEKDTLD